MRYYTVGAGRASAGVFADVEKKDRERLARAMKAVLLAAKVWGRSCRAENPSVDLEVRMLAAVNRLAKIEKEVSTRSRSQYE